MIDRTFIEKICELSAPAVLNIEGRSYSSKTIHPVHDPMPDALNINTLTGIVDFIGGIDGIGPDKAIIHVSSETDVTLIGALAGVFRNRDTYVHAKYANPTFRFGQWMDLENFIINIQAGFVQDEMTATILKVVGNLKDETVTNFSDDGKTQAVTAKTGIAMVSKVAVPSPITLCPYRTFMEIEQPASSFIFRMKQQGNGQQPACSLFEADGKAWELEAMQRIKTWLEANAKGFKVIA